MVTVRIAKERIAGLVEELRSGGFNPSRAVLFGSVAKGTGHTLSDIDVALWDKKFTGCRPIDYEILVKFLRNYPRMELHTFPEGETADDNPFIAEIEKKGIEIKL